MQGKQTTVTLPTGYKVRFTSNFRFVAFAPNRDGKSWRVTGRGNTMASPALHRTDGPRCVLDQQTGEFV